MQEPMTGSTHQFEVLQGLLAQVGVGAVVHPPSCCAPALLAQGALAPLGRALAVPHEGHARTPLL
jgi:hypothetical protein